MTNTMLSMVPGGNLGEPELLSMQNVSKRFGATQALDKVHFTLRLGTIHALLGQNGAGKSTLIKILAGVYTPDSGDITVNGYKFSDPVAQSYLTFIHQDLGLVEWMSVAENVALAAGFERKAGLIHWKAVRTKARDALAIVADHINPDAPVSELTRADRSLVAIARALCTNAKIIVLDEPTASLPAKDSVKLFAVLEELKRRGHGIIYVSHRLDEVFAISDEYTVFRDGTFISTGFINEIEPEALILDIVGKKPAAYASTQASTSKNVRFTATGLESGTAGPVDFTVHAGEVVGMVGLTGAGHLDIGRCLAAIAPTDAGSMHLNGVPYAPKGPAHAVDAKVAWVTSNRMEEGCAPELSLTENLFANVRSRGLNPFSYINPKKERAKAQGIVEHFGVRPPNADLPIATLSGGNQQKVMIARWLSIHQELLILEEPTAGVDVGAKSDIYALLNESLEQGLGVVLVSSDFEEIAQVAHRVLVFVDGQISAELTGQDITISHLTRAASGLPAADRH